MKFEVGQNALDVCKTIVYNQRSIASVGLIVHEVDENWRQRYESMDERIEHMEEGFAHSKPLKERRYSRKKFGSLSMSELENLEEGKVWSVTSAAVTDYCKIVHIPMMNFHPEGGSREDIKKALKLIFGDGRKGALLNSGRYMHYYGDFLLSDHSWKKSLPEFLMPTFLVSQRYIGHRLHDGYCTLRLTADKKHKPKVPEVVEVIEPVYQS